MPSNPPPPVRSAVLPSRRSTRRVSRWPMLALGSPAEQERIFEKFQQVGEVLTAKPKGTGLGVVILPRDRRVAQRPEWRAAWRWTRTTENSGAGLGGSAFKVEAGREGRAASCPAASY